MTSLIANLFKKYRYRNPTVRCPLGDAESYVFVYGHGSVIEKQSFLWKPLRLPIVDENDRWDGVTRRTRWLCVVRTRGVAGVPATFVDPIPQRVS